MIWHSMRARRPWRIARRVPVVALLLTVAGVSSLESCADFDAPAPIILPDTLVATPSFARDVQPILTKRCATASCHTVVTQQGELALDSLHSYGELVNVPAATVQNMVRVAPYDATNSWLVRMISPDSAARDNLPRMPLGRTPLTEKQIGTIINWINQGAKNN